MSFVSRCNVFQQQPLQHVSAVVSFAARCVWTINSSIVTALSMSMLAATCELARSIHVSGSQKHWQIKSDESIMIEDTCFVQLNARNSSLSSVLGNVGGYLCLTRSIGLKELTDLRNAEVHRLRQDELAAEQSEKECNLFDDVKAIIMKRTRQNIKEERLNRRACVVPLCIIPFKPVPVTMLRPIHPTDAVYIEFENDVVSVVLTWLTEKGFVESKRARNPEQLPKGISRVGRLGSYIVMYTAKDGSKKRKLKRELPDALAFHADPHDSENENADEDGHEKDASSDEGDSQHESA